MSSQPFLFRFLRDLLALVAPFLLGQPQARRRSWLQAVGLLLATALLALGATALLVAAAALAVERLLGGHWRALAFPYLEAVLRWVAAGSPVALAVLGALAGLLALAVLSRGLPAPLRRRWWALAGLLTLLVVSTVVDVAFTEGNGAVMDALNQRQASGFWGTAAGLVAIYLLTLPIQFLNTYGQQRWALSWRNSRTAQLVGGYLADQNYYHLQADPLLQERLDNPDQRIADDVQLAVGGATSLFFGFCASLLSLGAYIVVLFAISPILVLTLAVATLLGNGVILPLVRHLGGLSFRQQALEAHYRFALVHIRSHAESLAFLRGEGAVARGLALRFQALITNLERLVRWRTLVGQSSGLYAFAMQFAPYVALSGVYFSGKVSLGDLTVGSLAFGQVQASLSFLIDRAETVSGLFASLHRIADLDSHLQAPAALAAPHASAGVDQLPGLRLTNLTVVHPGTGRPLLQGLNLVLPAGERLLITGPSGSGKTSLLRVLAGLAPPAAGTLELPPVEQVLVLPQQPFLPLGSLRDQMLFPGDGAAVADRELRQLMVRVGLTDLAEGHHDLAEVDDWGRVLSGGEQQRVGFARLLLRQPRLAILDEASSALDLAAEAALYGALNLTVPTVVSVGHRPSLRAFHSWELRLDGQGGWRLAPIPPQG